MALQNIGAANSDDAFYRYKMPKMVTKVEGRGNGIRTNIVNMVDIAKALARPASYTTKYFGCELGAQSKFDEKTGTSIVNGNHTTAKLAGLLENFIKKFVQCYGCGNPETEILITKSQMITLKCAACGYISDVDMRDKLTTFILKNPPEKKGSKDKKAMRRAEKERLKEGEAADEEQKKLKKEVGKKKGSSKDATIKAASTKKKANSSDEDLSAAGSQADENEVVTADEDDKNNVQWQTDTSVEAAKQRIQEQLSAATVGMIMLSTDEEKKPKPGKKSAECEQKAETKSVANGTNNSHEKLVAEIKEHLNSGSSPSKLKSFLGSLSGTSQEVMDALFEALFDGIKKGFAKEVVKTKNFLAAITQEDGNQLVLLRSIETFCKESRPEAMKEVAFVLKALYDCDVVDEEFIVEWYQQGVSGENKGSAIWKNSKPFIEWLQNAESESDE
ncbi:Translation initiation factor IF2/IF5 domain [Dillenia turbinata]|uniref:Translation initiation factor IF2/IF5 domain n=1 Tax=Dillenia turbinata TaxID=194707 RepID=A0AAN8VQN6_9MAGN